MGPRGGMGGQNRGGNMMGGPMGGGNLMGGPMGGRGGPMPPMGGPMGGPMCGGGPPPGMAGGRAGPRAVRQTPTAAGLAEAEAVALVLRPEHDLEGAPQSVARLGPV